MSHASEIPPDLLSAGRRRMWATAAPLGIALLLVLTVVPGWLSGRCQCRYTPVLFAERAGLERVVLPLAVGDARHADFADAMKKAGVFVDPDWELGLTEGGPAIYVETHRRQAVLALAGRVGATRWPWSP